MLQSARGHLLSFIPSPSINGFHIGPLFIHFYGLMYVVGITLAIIITRRRWRAMGGDPDLVGDVAIWAVPAGIIGGRIYFDITTPADIPHVWYGVFALWSGGLGIWGGIAGGAIAGIWRVRRAGASAGMFANAIAPALLVAQAVGRIGNYFNQELFGKPTSLPWALEISLSHRPAGYLAYSTFQPSFLYELIFDLAWAAALVWIGHHRRIRPWGLFALYVAGYSGYRIFEETIRIDSSEHFLGLRLNFYVATIMTLVGIAWFVRAQRRPADGRIGWPAEAAAPASPEAAPVTAEAGVRADAGVRAEAGVAGDGAASSPEPGSAGSEDSSERDSAVAPGSTPER
jgi:prolipoprotein diacylglyceryl transferase